MGAPPSATARGTTSFRVDANGPGGEAEIPRIQVFDGRNVHNIGNIWLNVTNFGVFGSQPGAYYPWSEAPSARWPASSSTEYLWAAGIWVGAMRFGEPHVSTAQFEMEFRPSRGPLGRMFEARDGDEGGARAPSLDADDDHDGKTDEDPLDGRDNDGDGRVDEDFAAISTQMFTCEYSDTDPTIFYVSPQHVSLGVRVRQTSMAFDGEDKRNFIAFNYKITTDQSLEDVYVGILLDPDIGPPDLSAHAYDDMVGFWEGDVQLFSGRGEKVVPVSLGYMWDADADGQHSTGYVGFAFLGLERSGFGTHAQNRRVHSLPLHNFRSFSGTGPFILGGDPSNDGERYQVLEGSAPGSLSAGGGREPRASTTQNDYRFVVSVGPFGSLSPVDTLGITCALVIGEGFEGLKEAAAQAQIAFNGTWADCDRNLSTGVLGRETKHCGPEEFELIYPIGGPDQPWGTRVTPCDSLCQVNRWQLMPRCAARVPINSCVWINGDCDSTTGTNGNECLVHWFSKVPPPPPNMRLMAYQNQVDVLFDNRSEQFIDPLLNVADFESYRIWRSENWTRPLGSGLDTGPLASSWTLLAEYDLRGNGVGSESGLADIRYAPNVPPFYVELCREWDRAHPGVRPPLLAGFTEGQLDTALAMARGARYYRWVDPPFVAPPRDDDPPCRADGGCDPIEMGSERIYRRCDARGRCRAAATPPRTGAHYFYSVTATDAGMERRPGRIVFGGSRLSGAPHTNFQYVVPPSAALRPEDYHLADQQIYVVPNPATATSLAAWALHPNNDDPTGLKVEFHHLPAARGKVTIFTLAGDMVKEIGFDGRGGNGTARWDLVNRNGQEVTSGVYLYTVEADDPAFKRFVSKFVVVR